MKFLKNHVFDEILGIFFQILGKVRIKFVKISIKTQNSNNN